MVGETWGRGRDDALCASLMGFRDARVAVGYLARLNLLSLPGPGWCTPEKGVDPARDPGSLQNYRRCKDP